MIKLELVDDDFSESSTDTLTFDDGAIVLWAAGSVVGRFSQAKVRAVHLVEAPAEESSLERRRREFPNVGRPWTEEEESRLADLHRAGMTMAEISRELGRKPGGIRNRLQLLGLIELSASANSNLGDTP